MSPRYNRAPLTPEERDAAEREAKRKLKKLTGQGRYRPHKEVYREDGRFNCSCRPDCNRGVTNDGEVSRHCLRVDPMARHRSAA